MSSKRFSLSSGELRDRAILIMALFVCVVASVIVLENKAGYFLDEYLSLLRANAPFELVSPPYTLSHTPALAFFQDYLAVHPGHEFDYVNVWQNEAINVHPPLYYVLVHTLCSLVPGEIAEWSLMVVNVAFTLLTLIVGYKLLKLFTRSRLVLAVALLAFPLSAGVLNMVVFLRMYCMAMLWCTLFCYLLCARMQNAEPIRFFNVKLALTVFAGAMTHYYCIIYFVFACACFFIWLAVRRQFRQLGHAVAAMACAGIASVAFFSKMLYHIFSGYRGVESWGNLTNYGDFSDRLETYVTRTDSELFGSLALLLVALLAILAIVVAVRHARSSLPRVDEHAGRNLGWQMAVLLVPVALYFLVVVKISSYWNMNRYLYPIYPLIIWSFAITLWQLTRFAVPRKPAIAMTCIVLVIVTGSGLLHASWNNLYLDQAQVISSASERTDLDCVVVTDTTSTWPILAMLECKPEASQYASLNFVDSRDPSELRRFADHDELTLFIENSFDEQSVRNLAEEYGLPSNVECNYVYTEFTGYHLTRNTDVIM